MPLYKSSKGLFSIFSLAGPKTSMALMCFYVDYWLSIYIFICLFVCLFIYFPFSLWCLASPDSGLLPLDGMMDDPRDAVSCHNQMFRRDSASSIRPRPRPLAHPPPPRSSVDPAADTSNLAAALSGDVGEQKKTRLGLGRSADSRSDSYLPSPIRLSVSAGGLKRGSIVWGRIVS